MSYHEFAAFYDLLQADVNYDARADYLMSLFSKYDRLPTLLLDVACGTGGFSLRFKKRGIDVIGVDPSYEMLSIARQKAAESGTDILLLCQSAAELDLYGTVDGAVCCLDSVNHITNKKELQESFNKISLFLEKDRLFIFDVNTIYKHENVLSGNTFVSENDEVFCVWRNSECSKENTVDIRLDFFEKAKGSYQRYSEEFSERAYTDCELKEMLDTAGLSVVSVLGDMTVNQPKETEERVIYVTRKR